MCGYFSAGPAANVGEFAETQNVAFKAVSADLFDAWRGTGDVCGYAASALGNEVRDFTDITRRPAESASSMPPADSDDQVRLH